MNQIIPKILTYHRLFLWLTPIIFLVLSEWACKPAPSSSQRPGIEMATEAEIGGPFTLIDHNGNAVTQDSYIGKALLIYFGYTYCPDICPMTLQIVNDALNQLTEDERSHVQPILISVDPERDTPESLSLYVTAPGFPSDLVGLTGSQEQIRNVTSAYKVYYARVDDGDSLSDYLVDHFTMLFLMDKKGKFVELLRYDTGPTEISSRLKQFLSKTPA